MNKFLILILILTLSSCKAQTEFNSTIEFTSDLDKFENLSSLKESLKDVEIVSLGENTHGLGEVFKAKVDLVKFLHQEMGFNLVLFESGYGDAGLAWEKLDSLSTKEFTNSFTSNYYYHSEEIRDLMEYVKSQDKNLVIQGFDCQPQQDYLSKRMMEIMQPVDSILSKSVESELRNFNKLYQFENDKDTIGFNNQRSKFINFITQYETTIQNKKEQLLKSNCSENELNTILKSIEIFKNTYSKIQFGDMMNWQNNANIRDKSMFETIRWFKDKNPNDKIIIWAQNSHIENSAKPNYTVNFMGHRLKGTYGDKYYSIGAIVYSGINLNYNGTFDFEHNTTDYLAYHLNQFKKDEFVLDLRNYNKKDFTSKELLGMESNGNTAGFVAKDRFDGLLFIKYSNIPKLIKKE
jgi:erythromycin esterase